MAKLNSLKELNDLREFAVNSLNKQKKKVLVCCGTGCVAGGSLIIYDKIKTVCEKNNIDVFEDSNIKKIIDQPTRNIIKK